MSELPTIDEVLEPLHSTHCQVNSRTPDCICGVKDARAHLEKLMAVEQLDGELIALQRQTFRKSDGTEYWRDENFNEVTKEDRIAQLTHQAQAGGEETV